MKDLLKSTYSQLLSRFGNRNWWPADTRDEIIIGAILTQNVSWRNVTIAIDNLKSEDLLNLESIHEAAISAIAPLIKPTRFYNVKARRLKNFTDYMFGKYSGNLDAMFNQSHVALREELLGVKGLGAETVDSILLYAGGKLTFVVDAYTMRILPRLGIGNDKWKYSDYQKMFMDNIKPDLELYKDYHAQIVHLGHLICKGNNPICEECPLSITCKFKKQLQKLTA
jgi:endonuclease-3 related protein